MLNTLLVVTSDLDEIRSEVLGTRTNPMILTISQSFEHVAKEIRPGTVLCFDGFVWFGLVVYFHIKTFLSCIGFLPVQHSRSCFTSCQFRKAVPFGFRLCRF